MFMTLSTILLLTILSPFTGSVLAGIGGHRIGNRASHWVTILGMAIAFACAVYFFSEIVLNSAPTFHHTFYVWGSSSGFQFNVGFLVDRLTAVMMLTVTTVSLLVHIYSIGYMKGDPGYARFFSYMSLFTFFMLLLVSADNFLLLFFGWEGVGLVSYLLISFWFQRESAAQGGLKAFIVNRVGDFGFILGIAAIFTYFGALDYETVFKEAPLFANHLLVLHANLHVSLITVICLLLFVGAMGKSAQVPLHVWLPESMEGPTPISALIHAATMVTAGVYMVARLSPLFELSEMALSVVLVVGATGALFLGIVAVVQNDIKRVIAYSTLSQLGYMMAANGASAFSASIFHLMTHASFKALLFLAAGSVIIALHHEQDMRKMGGLRKKMPITYATFLVGALALAAIPPFAGFYSKDAILEVVHLATIPGSKYAYICLLLGAFVTALYTFRAFFLTFHGKPRFDQETAAHVHESPLVVTIPLIILAVLSVLSGIVLVHGMLYDPTHSMLGNSVFVAQKYNFFEEVVATYQNNLLLIKDAFTALPFWFCASGILIAWIFYVQFPYLPALFARAFAWIYAVLVHKYGFDALNDRVFVRGSRKLSDFFFNVADVKLIDGVFVDGSGHVITRLSALVRRLQTGYIYHYALAILVGLFGFLIWLLV